MNSSYTSKLTKHRLSVALFFATVAIHFLSSSAPADDERVLLFQGVQGAPAPADPPAQTMTAFLEGVDSDGDGRVGSDEDNDGNDNIYGTFRGIPGFKSEGPIIAPVLRYNRVIIVSSGIFREGIVEALAGATSIEAAPGVVAVFDALDADGGAGFREPPIAAAQILRRCVLKNLTFRNWRLGVIVRAGGSVTIDHCTFEDFSDVNDAVFALDVEPRGHAVIQHSTFTRCGKTNGAAGGAIRFQTGAEGVVASTTMVDNYGAGILRADIKVKLLGDNVVARNGPSPRR